MPAGRDGFFMPFEFQTQRISGPVIIQPRVFGDERGFFMESFKASDFQKAGLETEFRQDNHSRSSRGVLRGLHYQLHPHAQGKLVRVIRGRAVDVAVDIRKGSSTFGQHIMVELSEENQTMFWIPVGFAHGFLALEDNTEFLYKTTDEYHPELERGLLYNDPALGIDWPIPESERIVAKRDLEFPTLDGLDTNIEINH